MYEQLVHDRIAGALPESFTQTEISQRYDVDRGVLTRTLVKLSEDGLIARNAGHGWRFLQTLNSDVALRTATVFRLMIEPTALLTPPACMWTGRCLNACVPASAAHHPPGYYAGCRQRDFRNRR